MGAGASQRLGYFGLAEGDAFAGAVGAAETAGEGLAAGLVATDGAADGFAAGLVAGAGAPGATVAAGSGGLMLTSSTSKIRVAFGPMSWPAPRSP